MPEPAPPPDAGPDPGAPLRVLVVDDEALGRQRLLDLLDGLPYIGEVRVAETGRAAVEALRRDPPDVVFLDVQMPGMTGLDVVRTVGPERMPVTVFVTAYDRHALAAFDLAALDYLLKPFEDERFRQALDRAREAIHLRRVGTLQARLGTLFQAPPTPPPAPPRPAYLERVAVEMRGQVRVVPVAHIDYVLADGPYAEIHAGRDTFVIRERMQALEERLDPERFFRIHRSSIVQLDRIEALLTAPGGDYAVRLRSGERLKVSRTRRDALADRLGLEVRG